MTKFATKKLHIFEFQVWALVAAFLAFLTLKFQTNRKTSLKPSSEHIHAEKIWKNDISSCLAFDLAFLTFIGLFQFFCGLWSIISPVLYSSDIIIPSIISKSYCWKFPISDHCDMCGLAPWRSLCWHGVPLSPSEYQGSF